MSGKQPVGITWIDGNTGCSVRDIMAKQFISLKDLVAIQMAHILDKKKGNDYND